MFALRQSAGTCVKTYAKAEACLSCCVAFSVRGWDTASTAWFRDRETRHPRDERRPRLYAPELLRRQGRPHGFAALFLPTRVRGKPRRYYQFSLGSVETQSKTDQPLALCIGEHLLKDRALFRERFAMRNRGLCQRCIGYGPCLLECSRLSKNVADDGTWTTNYSVPK